MHYHTVAQEPGDGTNAYCEDHATPMIAAGEMMHLCGCGRGERDGCVICEEHDEVL